MNIFLSCDGDEWCYVVNVVIKINVIYGKLNIYFYLMY